MMREYVLLTQNVFKATCPSYHSRSKWSATKHTPGAWFSPMEDQQFMDLKHCEDRNDFFAIIEKNFRTFAEEFQAFFIDTIRKHPPRVQTTKLIAHDIKIQSYDKTNGTSCHVQNQASPKLVCRKQNVEWCHSMGI